MHIVIMGCGRVGASLAEELESQGHSIAIIDRDERAFMRLHDGFRGTTIHGIGFDQRVLEQARTSDAVAFAAVAGGDNSNILAARAARNLHGVRTVVARIYDPKRAEVYERLGIATVATARWTKNQMLARLIPGHSEREYQDASGAISLVAFSVDPSWVSTPLTEVEQVTGSRLAFVSRGFEGVLPSPDYRIQEGDVLHVAVRTEREQQVSAILLHAKEGA